MGEWGERDGGKRKPVTSDEFQIHLGVGIRCLIGGFRSDRSETHEIDEIDAEGPGDELGC